MNKSIKKMIIQAAKTGFPISSIGLHIKFDSRFTEEDYTSFCKWAIENDKFYRWLLKRIK